MKNNLLSKTVITILLIIMAGCMQKKETILEADLILVNGNVITVSEKYPSAESVAIKDNKIIWIGNNEEAENYIGSSTVKIDLNGKTVIPGFVESHAHFLGLGESLRILDLRNAANWDEVVKIVEKAAAKSKPKEWIIGRGWHQEKFNPAPKPNVHGYPLHTLLSKVSLNNPVLLSHASGHATFANAMAMEMAGVNSATKNPVGGTIIKDENGNPIGVFEENAELLVTKAYNDYLNKRNDEQKLADYYEQVKLASEDCLKKGITSFHDAGETFEVIDILKKLGDEEKLPIRLNVMIGETLENIETKVADYKLIGYANNFLNVRSIKQYIDGALGSRGAWLLKPYSDLPNHTGSNVTPVETLTRISEIGAINGFQMRIHAIGDRANREVLDIYEKVFDQNKDKNDFRWCIEHAQHISKEDISRFAKLGVIAAMQAIHCTSDASFVDERLGDKRAEEGAYVWKKLLESGAVICNGTDAPVEDVDPIKCYYSSVTRKSKDGTTFYPEQIMTRMEALKSYTTNGAYASFEEKIKGKIEPGMLADLTVLSNDIINCSDDEILGTKVLYTIIDGKIKYQSN
jgi:hypothetical protein